MINYPIEAIRRDFPILSRPVNGRPLVYFDNGATTQTPNQVVKAMEKVYLEINSNIHRGVHTLSNLCTEAFENARKKAAKYVGAASEKEVIFTRGTTEAINLVAHSFGETFLGKDDEIIISAMEHHSNIVPWQLLQKRAGIILRIIPVNDDGSLDMEEFHNLLNPKTKLVAVTHLSNVLGTINPVEKIIEAAHNINVPVLIDGAQAIQHLPVDVQKLDCDFYAFSGHKLYGPTGIGILYGKEKWLNEMVPWQGGGEMIQSVSFEKTTFNELPYKFEAGTPDYVAAIGLGAAMDYVGAIGFDTICEHETELFQYAFDRLSSIEGMQFYGTAEKRTSLISFLIKGIHPFDAGTLLDKMGIAVRTGHHCAQPLMDRFNIPGTIRASFGLYNTKQEVDALVDGLIKVKQLFG
ncbi:aminotransferase class V-fold PLP-dependent enzyme [Alkalitalea saponilacus]|uniref:Cysteine desulfurase n=1 Tax=Alkalitalea saponilacus TaxID=889453 RepID=A0A1T5FUS3_9BACT|nr:cysteine desulfurase [Alkalitalea saponilacus]ASB49499.1 cysteine desulfurase CsdA [Alkalitalea saponilacus]SKB99882.1 cysteine desulfurase / selenocysteine lyase [Alkalitalea saponilacus]